VFAGLPLDSRACLSNHGRMTREIVNEDDAFAGIVERLAQRFPEVTRSDVQGVVDAVRHVFDDAKVRDFVPVFVEREASRSLSRH
jgi:hypothetical protein